MEMHMQHSYYHMEISYNNFYTLTEIKISNKDAFEKLNEDIFGPSICVNSLNNTKGPWCGL